MAIESRYPLQFGKEVESLPETSSQIEISRSNISYGEAYIANYRNSVLDDGATFFPSDAGYQVGKLKESGVMNDCSLLLLPSAVKAGTLYSVKPQDRTGDFTVDRNCTATYIDEDGIRRIALANVPRIDYSSGEAALLVEPQSTNLITYSEDFSDASWNKERTIVDYGYLSPDNSLNSTKLIPTTDDGNHIISSAINNTTNSTLSFSFILKKAEFKNIEIRIRPSTGEFYRIHFDLDLGAINNILTTNTIANIEPYPNGYYRCTISTTVEVNSNYAIFYCFVLDDNFNEYFIGNGTNGLYMWGSQVEEGSTATSYIPTNGTTVTRLADNISVPTPAGVTSITETIDGVEQTPITTIPTTYSLPVGNINKVTMQ